MAEMQKAVVVTGVSTGIGWGAAKVLTAAGYKVFGSVRKEADAKRLQTELGANFVPLIFDVTDEVAVRKAVATVRSGLNGQKLFGLVNNAGISVVGPLLHIPLEEFRRQIEVNITGMLITIQAFGPLLGADENLKGAPGRVVNISSVGGTSAFPFIGAYNISKFGVEALSESLRRELLPFGIDVVVVAPGAVATAIWEKGEQADVSRYANTIYAGPLNKFKAVAAGQAAKGIKPEKLGQLILQTLTVANPKVRYVITPEPFVHWVLNNFPKRRVDRIVGGQLGLLPKKG